MSSVYASAPCPQGLDFAAPETPTPPTIPAITTTTITPTTLTPPTSHSTITTTVPNQPPGGTPRRAVGLPTDRQIPLLPGRPVHEAGKPKQGRQTCRRADEKATGAAAPSEARTGRAK
ncbi:unnamed protein product [Protopolystoma xenopodis]|uniref:Uncharacterized protein n=1 Tax=Protopolystoma xenopodis TaxID=117903 RepID=A0A448XIY8_9PLAT|nr:unnamed protein product [Protopolystoma xenopodis]